MIIVRTWIALDSNPIFISFHLIHCALQTTAEEEGNYHSLEFNARSFSISFEFILISICLFLLILDRQSPPLYDQTEDEGKLDGQFIENISQS